MFTATEYDMNYYLRMTPRRYYNCVCKIEKKRCLWHRRVCYSFHFT